MIENEICIGVKKIRAEQIWCHIKRVYDVKTIYLIKIFNNKKNRGNEAFDNRTTSSN